VTPQQFGARLRELRDEKGLSQKQLADAAGVSQNGVSEWERGEREPSSLTVLKLAAALGVESSAFEAAPSATTKPRGRGRPQKPAGGEAERPDAAPAPADAEPRKKRTYSEEAGIVWSSPMHEQAELAASYLLADGRWHSEAEVAHKVRDLVPPERLLREVPPRQLAAFKKKKLYLSDQIDRGAERLARSIVAEWVRRGELERRRVAAPVSGRPINEYRHRGVPVW
jgi:transcriptional regulator with XRE-family HTH domain